MKVLKVPGGRLETDLLLANRRKELPFSWNIFILKIRIIRNYNRIRF